MHLILHLDSAHTRHTRGHCSAGSIHGRIYDRLVVKLVHLVLLRHGHGCVSVTTGRACVPLATSKLCAPLHPIVLAKLFQHPGRRLLVADILTEIIIRTVDTVRFSFAILAAHLDGKLEVERFLFGRSLTLTLADLVVVVELELIKELRSFLSEVLVAAMIVAQAIATTAHALLILKEAQVKVVAGAHLILALVALVIVLDLAYALLSLARSPGWNSVTVRREWRAEFDVARAGAFKVRVAYLTHEVVCVAMFLRLFLAAQLALDYVVVAADLIAVYADISGLN